MNILIENVDNGFQKEIDLAYEFIKDKIATNF